MEKNFFREIENFSLRAGGLLKLFSREIENLSFTYKHQKKQFHLHLDRSQK